jgi:hypothetical protein
MARASNGRSACAGTERRVPRGAQAGRPDAAGGTVSTAARSCLVARIVYGLATGPRRHCPARSRHPPRTAGTPPTLLSPKRGANGQAGEKKAVPLEAWRRFAEALLSPERFCEASLNIQGYSPSLLQERHGQGRQGSGGASFRTPPARAGPAARRRGRRTGTGLCPPFGGITPRPSRTRSAGRIRLPSYGRRFPRPTHTRGPRDPSGPRPPIGSGRLLGFWISSARTSNLMSRAPRPSGVGS